MLFYLGWALMLLAFAAASAETLPRALPGVRGMYISAYDLWYAAAPGNLVVAQIRIEKFLHPWLWDPVIVTVLVLPAWALFGLPGVALAWFCRSHRTMTEQQLEEFRKHEESLFLFDKLAREAKEAGFGIDEDDRLPDHGQHGYGNSEGILPPLPDNLLPDEPDPADLDLGNGAADGGGEGDGAGDGAER